MTGSWRVRDGGRGRAAGRTWLVLRRGEREALQLAGRCSS